MTTQSSSKQEKFRIIQNFSMSWSIIRIDSEGWSYVSGPYLTESEAIVDLRNIKCEQE